MIKRATKRLLSLVLSATLVLTSYVPSYATDGAGVPVPTYNQSVGTSSEDVLGNTDEEKQNENNTDEKKTGETGQQDDANKTDENGKVITDQDENPDDGEDLGENNDPDEGEVPEEGENVEDLEGTDVKDLLGGDVDPNAEIVIPINYEEGVTVRTDTGHEIPTEVRGKQGELVQFIVPYPVIPEGKKLYLMMCSAASSYSVDDKGNPVLSYIPGHINGDNVSYIFDYVIDEGDAAEGITCNFDFSNIIETVFEDGEHGHHFWGDNGSDADHPFGISDYWQGGDFFAAEAMYKGMSASGAYGGFLYYQPDNGWELEGMYYGPEMTEDCLLYRPGSDVGTQIKKDMLSSDGALHVYAKWEPITAVVYINNKLQKGVTATYGEALPKIGSYTRYFSLSDYGENVLLFPGVSLFDDSVNYSVEYDRESGQVKQFEVYLTADTKAVEFDYCFDNGYWSQDAHDKIKLSDISYGNNVYQLFFSYRDQQNNEKVDFVNSKAQLATILGVKVEDITSENCKFEVVKKGSNGSYSVINPASEGPVNMVVGKDTGDLIVTLSKKSEIPKGEYAIRVTLDFERIPEAKRVKTLPIINEPEVFCDSKSEALQAVRDIITGRVNNMSAYSDASNYRKYDTDGYVYERIYVKENIFRDGSINLLDVADFEAEREGMKSNEGDYMFNLIGNRIQRSFYYEAPCKADQNNDLFGYTRKGDTSYDIYEVYLPVITTKAEEDEVDAKVEKLINSQFASVKNGTNEQKIKAVYDYVTGNVKGKVSGAGGSDRTYPLYHTAYHALIKGNGTCESYAQLFTRLTRELGVPSKVIMGVDANNHTYNIVQNDDGYWYFIDCSSNIFLKDSAHFSRAKEQERYTSAKYILNYWNYLKGGSNYHAEVISVLKDGKLVLASDDPQEIHDYIAERLSNETGTKYVIQFASDNWKFEAEHCLFSYESDSAKRVSVDLNGHTISFKNNCAIEVGSISNGTVQVGYKDKRVSYSGSVDTYDDITIKDVNFVGVTGFDAVNISSANTTVLLDNVTFKKLSVNIKEPNGSSDSFNYSVAINNDITFDGCSLYVADNAYSNHPVIVAKTFEEGGNLKYSGKLVFKNGTILGGMGTYNDTYPYYFTYKPVEFAVSGAGSFASGDVVATVSGNLKKYTSHNGATEAATLTEIADAAATSNFVTDDSSLMEINGSLVFAKATFEVFVGEVVPDNSIGSYVTWADAIKAINAKNNASAEYTIKLLEDASGAENITMPGKASALTIDGAGHTFAHSGNVTLTLKNNTFENLTLKPVTAGATLNINGKNLTFKGVTLDSANGAYASITGSGTSDLCFDTYTGDETIVNTISYTGKLNVAKIRFTDESSDSDYNFSDVTATNLWFNCDSQYLNFGKVSANTVWTQSFKNSEFTAPKISFNTLVATTLIPEAASVITIKESATIGNLLLGQTYSSAKGTPAAPESTATESYLIRNKDTKIAINTKLATARDGYKLVVATQNEDDNEIETVGGTVLFTTRIKNFPTNLVKVNQPDKSSKYTALAQFGNDIVVSTEWLKLFKNDEALSDNGYVKWSDLIARIEKENDKTATYTVKLTENVNTKEKLTFPKKASGFNIMPDEGVEKAALTFNGDFAPTMKTSVERADMISTTKGAKLNLGGNALTLDRAALSTIVDETKGSFATVSGNAKSTLTLIGTAAKELEFETTGNINCGTLKLDSVKMTSGGSLTSATKCVLAGDSSIDVAAAVNFKDLESQSAGNKISFANKKGVVKVNGAFTVGEGAGNITAYTGSGADRHEEKVNTYAIDLTPKYMAGDYSSPANLKKDIAVAAKVPASMFVIGKGEVEGSGDSKKLPVTALTMKVKNGIRIDSRLVDGPVTLYEVAGDNEYALGSFETLTDSFAEITRLGDAKKSYLVTIRNNDPESHGGTSFTTNISTPKQAKEIKIKPESEATMHPVKLRTKNGITLGSSLYLLDVELEDNYDKKGNVIKNNITLGNSVLTLDLVKVSSEWIGNVSGGGVVKGSGLCISSPVLEGDEEYTHINGNINGVGTITLNGKKDTVGTNLFVNGKMNVGNIVKEGDYSAETRIASYYTIKKDKAGNVTAVTSNNVVNGMITSVATQDQMGERGHITIEPLYKNGADTEYVFGTGLIGADSSLITNPGKSFFQVVKAVKAATEYVDIYTNGDNSDYRFIKKGGFICLVSADYVDQFIPYYLHKELYDEYFIGYFPGTLISCMEQYSYEGTFMSFADVVQEINSRNDKNARYVISADVPEDESVVRPAEKLIMPKASAASTITITTENTAKTAVIRYPRNASTITLNCETCFENVILEADGGDAPLTLNIGNYGVYFDEPKGLKLKAVKGSGVGKRSYFDVNGGEPVVITGDLNNVAGVTLTNKNTDDTAPSKLIVYGKTNIGTLVTDKYCEFAGSCTYSLDKTKTRIAAVNTNININDRVGNDEDESDYPDCVVFKTEDGPVPIGLYTKSGNDYVPLVDILTGMSDNPQDITYDPADALKGGKIQVVKSGKKHNISAEMLKLVGVKELEDVEYVIGQNGSVFYLKEHIKTP